MRYSKQREAVYAALCSTDSHPDAYKIYEEVKKTMPSIGLGTVYRNLNELCRLNKIKKVSSTVNTDRFDANLSEHAHFVCTECERIYDMQMPQGITSDVEGVARKELTFYGVCENCRGK